MGKIGEIWKFHEEMLVLSEENRTFHGEMLVFVGRRMGNVMEKCGFYWEGNRKCHGGMLVLSGG